MTGKKMAGLGESNYINKNKNQLERKEYVIDTKKKNQKIKKLSIQFQVHKF